jgi:hypothetical protein
MRTATNILFAAILAVLASSPALAARLITPEEAQLPAASTPKVVMRSGVTRAPGVDVEMPKPSQAAGSPTDLRIRFKPHGGAKIDPASVRLTYLKTPAIDLTERVRPFVSSQGIDMPQAEMPPGQHLLQLDLRDSDGRTSSVTLTLNIVK